MTDYSRLDRDQIRNVIRALETQNKRQPTRKTMTKIQEAKKALRSK